MALVFTDQSISIYQTQMKL